jgi:ARG and Rhodanese-Phosphatase-superfamily-associated Protein domain
MAQASEIGHSLTGLRLGESLTYLNLTLFPLIGEAEASPPYVLLDEALDRQLVRVTEVSSLGAVPELALENTSGESVLLVDGDELVGAKQNRVLNLSILVAGGRRLTIPVSCVEQGRWAYRSSEFSTAKRTVFARARARKAQSVSEALRTRGDRRSNQSQIWADVAEKADDFSIRSATLAMSDIYVGRAAQLDAYVRAFLPLPAQRGAVVAVGGKVVGVELFDSASAFSRYLEKLIRAYALDAIGREAIDEEVPSEGDARAFLDLLWATHAERFKALGEGEDLRLRGQGIAGGALAAGGRLVCSASIWMRTARQSG